jgi:hypothetical protein
MKTRLKIGFVGFGKGPTDLRFVAGLEHISRSFDKLEVCRTFSKEQAQ